MKSVLQFFNGVMALIFYFINTLFWFIPIIIFSLFKLMPIKSWQKGMTIIVDACASNWISVNRLNQNLFSRTHFHVRKPTNLSEQQWYLVIANHQSWVDILVLQRIFNREIPFLKFFLKKNLIYVPLLGLAWWGLDFPFMQRYSRKFLEKNPHLKGSDLKTTQIACEKFQHKPVSIMNFVEGTRLTPSKLKQTLNKQLNLSKTLAPKSGGIAFVLNAMGERLSKLVNVTIYYPERTPSFWDFVQGKVKDVVVDIETIDIKQLFEDKIYTPAYFDDEQQKLVFQNWLNQQWQRKDAKLKQLDDEYLTRG